jgi:tRNA A37 methylthiotransferase MiaB
MVLQSKYAKFIEQVGYDRTDDFAAADVILVDTCAATHAQEEASCALIREKAGQAKAGAKVIVSGCLAGINPDRIRSVFAGDFFSPTNEFMLGRILGVDHEEDRFRTPLEAPGRFMGADGDVAVFLPQARRIAWAMIAFHKLNNLLPPAAGDGLGALPFLKTVFRISQQANARNYTVNISQGCMGDCTFCVIPKAKGRTKSLPMGLIVPKIQEKVAEGVRHITLASEDTGAYGVDIGTDIVSLLWKIHAIPGDFRLYVNFFDPRWLKIRGDRLIEFLATGRVVYLQSTIQSGSDHVLRLMRRGYTIDQAMGWLRKIRAACPDLTMTTQFIAGHPGERDDDVEATRRIIDEDLFDDLWVFDYDDRPGSEAEGMADHLPADEVARRGRYLRRAWLESAIRVHLGLRRGPRGLVSASPAAPPAPSLEAPAAVTERPANPFVILQ